MATAPRLPGYRGGQTASGGRITSSAVNSFARDPVERTISLAAKDALLRIVYGRTNIPGHLFAQGLIGSDLVLGYVLCIGQIDAVEMVQINDVNASTITGVTVTTYLGTPTQGVDPTLSSAIAAYNDSLRVDVGNGLRGIAYVVLRITSDANVGGWPRMRATIRGRKVFDPRTGLTTYSDNTALCTADLISDLDYGLGLTATNVEDVADWCDSFLADGTTKRSRIALVLERPRPILPDWLDLLSSYGEFYWIHEGADIKLVRDSAVDLASTPIEREWISGTLSVRHEDTADAPRSVDVIYTVPRTDSLPWATDSVRREFAGGAITPTTLRMEGIVSAAEADNKALAKLNRMQSRVSMSCEIPDRGVTYQIGDVVRIDSPARGITELPMRILEVGMSGPGRYRIAGEQYDPSHYPSETPPVQGAQLPAGAIILWDGGDAPTGFSDYTAANGRLLIGAGGALSQGETGGTGWDVTISGTTTTDGAHSPPWQTDVRDIRDIFGGASSEITINTGSTGDPVHNHSYSSGAITLNPRRRQQRLIKADSIADNVPVGGKLFGVSGIVGSGWSRDAANSGRLVEAAAANANTGVGQQNVSITTGSADDRHRHHTNGPNNTGSAIFPDFDLSQAVEGGSVHTHTASLAIVANLRRQKLALYQNSADAALLPGHIVAWEGGAVPADWVLCDGANNTPDCTDNFVEIAAVGDEGATGDNTATANATTSSVGHNHKGLDQINNRESRIDGHANNITHNHTISGSAAIDPPYYALAFIMFAPGA